MTGPIKSCVIGHPLSQTLSPLIHNYWFRHYGIDGVYEAKPVDPASFDTIAGALGNEYNGFNVTLPYKEKIVAWCTMLDEAASSIGAVNTVVVDRDGNLQGRNTDAYGFTQNLKEKAPAFEWGGGPALVLGAGGAARAVLHALKTDGVPDILIANRSRDKAAALAAHFGCGTVAWAERETALKDANLLVNTTPLGMTGQPPLAMALDALPAYATVCDIVYAPLTTPLIQAARNRGLAAVTGIGMLLHQAVPAFEAWTGVRPKIDAILETLVLEALS